MTQQYMVSIADEYEYGALVERRQHVCRLTCLNNALPVTDPTQTAEESNPDLHNEKLLYAAAMAQPDS